MAKYCSDAWSDPGDEEEGGWRTVRSKTRPPKQPSNETTPTQAPYATCVDSSGLEAHNQDEPIQSIKGPSKITRSSYWDGRNRFDLLRDIELDEDFGLSDTLEVNVASNIRDQVEVMDGYGSPLTHTTLASSPLKRKRSSTSSSNSYARKHVHVGDKVTVICDADVFSTADLPPCQSSFQRPHFSYTAADQARTRRNFWRRSHLYRPRTWALSGDYENVNTSHYKTTWTEYEAVIGL
jgi:hypothetical protein